MKQWDDSMVTEEGPPKTPKKIHNRNASKVLLEDMTDVEAQMDMKRRPKLTGGNGRNANLDLGCSCEDPLKWSPTTKNLLFGSLLMAIASISMLKTLLVTVNTVIATQFSVSYTGATALTGAPLILGACSGLLSRMLAKSIGKRAIYLVASVMMLLAALWNMHVSSNYSSFMASRIFQGIGWGAIEGLTSETMTDIFHPHERQFRTQILTFISLFFLLGTPIIGGYISQSTSGFNNQIMIINIIQAFSIVSLIFFFPETTFHHLHPLNNRNSTSTIGITTTIVTTNIRPSPSKLYLQRLKLSNNYSTQRFSVQETMKPVKAFAAPSTILTTLLTAPLLATAIGIAQSLSLLFTPMPTFLFPSRLGYLFTLPFIFTILLYPLSAAISRRSTSLTSAIVPGLILSVVGLLSFSIYVAQGLTPSSLSSSIFSTTTDTISLKIVSALFGCLFAGVVVLSTSTDNSDTRTRDSTKTLQELVAGIWVVAMPNWFMLSNEIYGGLRTTGVALAVVGILVCSTVWTVMFVKKESIRRWDANVWGRGEGAGEGAGEGEMRRFGKGFIEA